MKADVSGQGGGSFFDGVRNWLGIEHDSVKNVFIKLLLSTEINDQSFVLVNGNYFLNIPLEGVDRNLVFKIKSKVEETCASATGLNATNKFKILFGKEEVTDVK